MSTRAASGRGSGYSFSSSSTALAASLGSPTWHGPSLRPTNRVTDGVPARTGVVGSGTCGGVRPSSAEARGVEHRSGPTDRARGNEIAEARRQTVGRLDRAERLSRFLAVRSGRRERSGRHRLLVRPARAVAPRAGCLGGVRFGRVSRDGGGWWSDGLGVGGGVRNDDVIPALGRRPAGRRARRAENPDEQQSRTPGTRQ
jgi:hypothetical protein